jgi:putative addiction module killer protein
MGCATFVRGRECKLGSSVSPRVTLEMCSRVGEGVSELRIDYGTGYRVYFKKIGREIVILLAGGDKRTQSADIKTALRLARNL